MAAKDYDGKKKREGTSVLQNTRDFGKRQKRKTASQQAAEKRREKNENRYPNASIHSPEDRYEAHHAAVE